MKFRDKLASFFYGRNGVDQLYIFLMIIWFVLMLINLVLGFFEGTGIASAIIMVLSSALFIYMMFRVFSKNIPARRKENQSYLNIKNRITGWFRLQKRKFKERKTHSFKKCPNCKKTVRLKKIKGEHTVRCPLCSGTFKVKF
ncbi:MAG: hypothetical protein E7554_04125 [Ruminococcaceae bacterium]|nr:hypothetical protein [Oscillospiraceae bacterium]